MNYINMQAKKSENENHPRLAFRDMAFAKWAKKAILLKKLNKNSYANNRVVHISPTFEKLWSFPLIPLLYVNTAYMQNFRSIRQN